MCRGRLSKNVERILIDFSGEIWTFSVLELKLWRWWQKKKLESKKWKDNAALTLECSEFRV